MTCYHRTKVTFRLTVGGLICAYCAATNPRIEAAHSHVSADHNSASYLSLNIHILHADEPSILYSYERVPSAEYHASAAAVPRTLTRFYLVN